MKIRPLLLILAFAIYACPLLSQSDIASAVAKAKAQNDSQEYLAAAAVFHEVQQMAKSGGDVDEYFNSVIAEGECYYMLNLVSDLWESLTQARDAYNRYADSLEIQKRLRWKEAVSKLEGSYHFCMTDADPSAFRKAESAYKRCLDLIDEMNVDDKEMGIIIHRELLNLYYKRKDYKNALAEAEEVYNYYYWVLGYVEVPRTPTDERMNQAFVDATLSKAMVLGRLKRFPEAFETLSELPEQCDNLPSVLRTRGKLLMMQFDHDGTDRRAEALDYYSRYIALMKRQADGKLDLMTDNQREQYWLNLHDFLFDCYRLEDYAPEMLYDLALFSKGFLLEYHNKNRKESTWKDIRKALDDRTCAIEFVQYNGRNDARKLGALVLTKQCDRPRFLHIADVDSLMNFRLKKWVKLSMAMVSTHSVDKDAIYNDPDLPKLIWTDELLKATQGASKIYFSADGLLHQLAIEYMMPDTNRSCRRLTSTRRLLDPSAPLNQKRMLLMGGVDYDAPVTPLSDDNDVYAYRFLQRYANRLDYLPGTKREIDSILTLRQSGQDLKIDGAAASDYVFRTMANRYPMVHVATHGYFGGVIEDGSKLLSILRDNSMSQSGLAFAGAQYALKDSTHNPILSDGLLSAKEIATIPLDSVDLMVLSACQTGLGFITADGVYGIQRALKQAGVKALIVSLWSVDDAATSLLMMNFYDNLKNDENADIYEAFMKARQQLKDAKGYAFNKGKMSSEYINLYAAPQYMNAFILIDVK
jgi:hypothetical protein